MKINLKEAISKFLATKKKVFPCHVNRISSMDDNCLRRLYYKRTAWDKVAPTNDFLQGIFETGNTLEPVIERMVSELGDYSDPNFRIVGTQVTTNDKMLDRYKISGTIDGFLQVKDGNQWVTQGVIDIKTCSPNIFPRINSYDDLSKYPWTRKYRGQLMLYALAHNLPMCYILFVNKGQLYDMKLIEFPLDFDYAEGLLNKAEAVNLAVDSNTPPDKLNDPDECPRCEYAHICHPEYSTGGNLEIVSNDELEAILERLTELEPATAEAKELTKQRDVLMVKGQDMAIGRFLVVWKHIEGNRKPSLGGPFEQWRKKIVAG